jgi:hypothetical protein|nr:hypothetical protein [Ensifer sp. SSB1]
MNFRSTAFALGAFAALNGEALAQESIAYVDDRSDGAALVRSLYNAINRREYARAYGYFGESKPVGGFKSFTRGYDRTVSVEVKVGKVKTEAGAGSIYSAVPVAVKSIEKRARAVLRRLLRHTHHQPFAAGATLHALPDRSGAAS